MHSAIRIILWVILPALNFRFWYRVSRQHSADVASNSEYLLDVSKVGVVGDFENKFLLKLDLISDFMTDIVTNSHEESNAYGISQIRRKKCKSNEAGHESIHSYISRRNLLDEEGSESGSEADTENEMETGSAGSNNGDLEEAGDDDDDYYGSGADVDIRTVGGEDVEENGDGTKEDDYYGSGVASGDQLTKDYSNSNSNKNSNDANNPGSKHTADDYYGSGVDADLHNANKEKEASKPKLNPKKNKKDAKKGGVKSENRGSGDDYYGGLINGGAKKAAKNALAATSIGSFDIVDGSTSNNNNNNIDNNHIGCSELEELDKNGCPKLSKLKPSIYLVPAEVFDKARVDKLAEVPYMKKKNTVVAKRDASERCDKFVSDTSGTIIGKFCFAVVRVKDFNSSMNLIRIARNIDDAGNDLDQLDIVKKTKLVFLPVKQNEHNDGLKRPTGFFRSPPKQAGRNRVKQKMEPFLTEFSGDKGIESQLSALLRANNIRKGSDLIVMVLNEGELDLYLNFACSCKFHNISMRQVLVFSGNEEAVPVIESTGAMGMYHIGFASVSKKASNDYLDRVFVDMMWYKAFSIFLVLRMGINVLFQDLDLVWFKEPFQYFRDYLNATYSKSQMSQSFTEAFFSDDGQRSHRYTPFFANSGFYYLLASDRSVNFAWSIMASFDTVQVGGSHQNVFTMKLVEGLGIGYPQVKLLPLNDFPTGMLYHHSKKYMANMQAKKITPYHFHMCWTGGKADKLRYFKETSMWYVHETCQLPDIIEGGSKYANVVKDILAVEKSNIREKIKSELFRDSVVKSSFKVREFLWDSFANACCSMMPKGI